MQLTALPRDVQQNADEASLILFLKKKTIKLAEKFLTNLFCVVTKNKQFDIKKPNIFRILQMKNWLLLNSQSNLES